eukprot:1147577-Pelagomonas_calceolata.AAC.3
MQVPIRHRSRATMGHAPASKAITLQEREERESTTIAATQIEPFPQYLGTTIDKGYKPVDSILAAVFLRTR